MSKGLRKNKFGELAYRRYICLECNLQHARFLDTKYGVKCGTLVKDKEE